MRNLGKANRPLRLVHVTTVPVSLGFLKGQAGYLRSRGFKVSVITSPGDGLDAFREEEGVECFCIPMERAIAPFRDALALARLWILFRRLSPDIVDAHTPKAGMLGVTAAWLAGIPVRVYHLHGLRFLTMRGAKRLLLVACERMAALLATRVLCVSHSCAAIASACALAPEAKLDVLLSGSINGIDVERFLPPDRGERDAARAALGIPSECRVVGFVGRLVRDKGIIELAAAWQVLRSEMPDLRLVLVGPFESQDPVPTPVASQLLADPRVRTVGFVRDTITYYRAFDVVALPTYREGFGLVSVEAAAMSLPVVSTRVPGCTDAVIDGVTGTLVAPRDAKALANALRTYLNDPALRQRHGAAGRERVAREFRQERMWKALSEEYLRLLAQSGRVAVSAFAPNTASNPEASSVAPTRGGIAAL